MQQTTRATTEHPLVGKTIRWTYEDGPTAGTTYEHEFPEGGGVSFTMVGAAGKGRATFVERCAVVQLTPKVLLVSYPSASGYTLTTCLDLGKGRMVSVASSESDWGTQQGTFEVVRSSTRTKRSRPAPKSVDAKPARTPRSSQKR